MAGGPAGDARKGVLDARGAAGSSTTTDDENDDDRTRFGRQTVDYRISVS